MKTRGTFVIWHIETSSMANYQQSGPTTFEDLVEPLPENVREIANRLRGIVRDAIPEADESVSGGVKIGMVLYSIGGPNNVVCGFQPTHDMCKVFFHGWHSLKEAGYRLEGSGKHARHIKIHSNEDIQTAKIADMIRIAFGAR